MFIGIITLVLGLVFLIIDGVRTPKWQMASTIGRWLNNRIVRRILRILLALAITVGSLFIISTIGFLTKITWLTVIPVAAAMIVIWIVLISGAALEQAARGFAKLLGFNIVSQTTLEAWEKSFLSVFFWVYLMLALYPVYNPWTGNPAMVIFIAMFGLALATYARWAADAGKKPKIFGLILVPLLFLYCLGKQQPNVYPTLGSLVNWIEAIGNRENTKRDLGSAAKNQQARFYRDGEEIVKNNTYALLKSDVAALDEDLKRIILEGGYKEKVKILQKLAVTDLPPNLEVYFGGSTESFYKIQFMDELGKYSIRSKIGYIETSSVKGIINIPEAPEIKKSSSRAGEGVIKLTLHKGSNFIRHQLPEPIAKNTLVKVQGRGNFVWGLSQDKYKVGYPLNVFIAAPIETNWVLIRFRSVHVGAEKNYDFKVIIGGV